MLVAHHTRPRRSSTHGRRATLKEIGMTTLVRSRSIRAPRSIAPGIATLLAVVAGSTVLYAQSPWERAASNLEATFTGPLARSLSLVSIVIGGLMFMFGEGGAKRQISGIVFGGGLALFAGQFLAWLF
jgi:type IV secretory pathway VirB2 component (pilin)